MVYFLGFLSFALLGVACIEFSMIAKLCIENYELVMALKKLALINRELQIRLNELGINNHEN